MNAKPKDRVFFVPAGLQDAATLHGLYLASPGYFALIGGHVPSLGEVEMDLLTALEDPYRQIELIEDGRGNLVGSLDYKREYPDPGDLTVNLLLIAQSRQSAGWGQRVMAEFEAREAPRTRRILASVLGENARAAHFWERLGYRFALDARPVLTWYAKELGAPPVTRELALAHA